MPSLRFVAGMLSVGVMALGAGMAFGQDYPNKPIRVLTGGIGGASDFTSRLIAQGLTANLRQQVIVDNRAGSVIILAEIVTKASPDGYTLLIGSSNIWLSQFLQKTPYDPVQDFAPISMTNRQPNVLVVHPSVAANSVRELIALAKARQGELNYSTGSTGGATHLAAELFKAMAGVNMVRIPYKGSGPALNALLAGEVQLSFTTTTVVTSHVKSGRLKALAVTSVEPSALAPGLPTVAATGLPGYEAVAMTGIFAPPKTPATLINRLNQEILRFLKTAEAKEKFFNIGAETVGSSPELFAAAIKSEMAAMGKVIKDAGIREE